MTERMDVLAPTQPNKDGKSYLNRVGTAWATSNGGWRLILDALPLPVLKDNGKLETSLLLMPPKPKDDAPRGSDTGSDDIPF